jgi:acetyltransferase
MPGEVKMVFEPKSVVLVGASDGTEGGAVLPVFFHSLIHNMRRSFKGKTHLVDLRGKIEGAVKNLNRVPKRCDLAVVVLPPKLVMRNWRKLLDLMIKTMVLAIGGFDQQQREELARGATKRKVCVIGPNATAGVINTAKGLCATLASGLMPPRGSISVISQNGTVGTVILGWACFHGVGVSKFVSTGDGVDVTEADLLEFLARDKETNVICIYLESVRDGRRFLESIREAVKKKPVVVLKGGTARGEGERDKIFAASLKQVGAIRVSDVEELLGVADALAKQSPMQGDRVAVVTNAGGPAVLVADSLSSEGLVLARLSDEVVKKITGKFPDINVVDWVDLGIDAKDDHYKFVLEQVLSEPSVDGVVTVNELKLSSLEPEDVRAIAEATKKSKNKPVVSVAMGGEDCALVREALKGKNVPVYDSPMKAIRALSALRSYGKTRAKIGK